MTAFTLICLSFFNTNANLKHHPYPTAKKKKKKKCKDSKDLKQWRLNYGEVERTVLGNQMMWLVSQDSCPFLSMLKVLNFSFLKQKLCLIITQLTLYSWNQLKHLWKHQWPLMWQWNLICFGVTFFFDNHWKIFLLFLFLLFVCYFILF